MHIKRECESRGIVGPQRSSRHLIQNCFLAIDNVESRYTSVYCTSWIAIFNAYMEVMENPVDTFPLLQVSF